MPRVSSLVALAVAAAVAAGCTTDVTPTPERTASPTETVSACRPIIGPPKGPGEPSALTPDYETLPADTAMIVWPVEYEARDPHPDLVVEGFGPSGDLRFHAMVRRSGLETDEPGIASPAFLVGSHHLASVRRTEYGGPVIGVLVYDLTDPQGGPAWSFPADGAWSGPHGLLAVRSEDGTRMSVLDVRGGRLCDFAWEFEDFDAWIADGSGFLIRGRDPAAGPGWPREDGVLTFEDGHFHEQASIPDLFVPAGVPQQANADGLELQLRSAYDDMGKGTAPYWLVSGAPSMLEALPNEPPWPSDVAVWYESRVDDAEWLFSMWDVDGRGILVVERTLTGAQIVRMDRPGQRDVHPIASTDPLGGNFTVESLLSTGGEGFTMVVTLPGDARTDSGFVVDATAQYLIYSSATGEARSVVGPVPATANFAGYAPR